MEKLFFTVLKMSLISSYVILFSPRIFSTAVLTQFITSVSARLFARVKTSGFTLKKTTVTIAQTKSSKTPHKISARATTLLFFIYIRPFCYHFTQKADFVYFFNFTIKKSVLQAAFYLKKIFF